MTGLNTSKQAIVAGGGPVGALTAIALAQQGWQVQVFDSHPLPSRRPAASDTRAYMLNLSERALRVFKLMDVEVTPLIAPHGDFIETTFYDVNGKVTRSMKDTLGDPLTRLRVFRDEIACQLVDEAQRLYPNSIKFHFGVPIKTVDLDAQTVTASQDAGLEKQVHYDLLVGADGASSVVRAQMQNAMPSNFVRRIRHDVVYCTAGAAIPSEQLPGHAFFEVHPFQEGAVFWNGRGDGDVRVGFFVPVEFAEQIKLGDLQWLRSRMQTDLPSLPQLGKEAILKLVESNPPFHPLASWTHVSQLHGPQVVLLGDAAHTMTPILGQGLNCGIEDVQVFANILQQHQGHLGTALPAYTKARWPDIEALLNVNEIVASQQYRTVPQDQTWAHKLFLISHGVLLKLHLALHTLLHKALPSVFEPAAFITSMSGKSSYRSLVSAMYMDAFMMASVLAGCVAGFVYGAK